MIEFEKLEKVLKIWLIGAANAGREDYVGFAHGRVDDLRYTVYYINQNKLYSDAYSEIPSFNSHVYILKAPRKTGTDFFISFDDVSNAIICITEHYIHYLKDKESKNFTDSNIRKLVEMIKEPDKVIDEHLKKEPEFDMNNKIELSEIILTAHGCDILFTSSKDLDFDQYNNIYVGCRVNEIFYPFQIIEKSLTKCNPPIYRATYTGNCCIDSKSTESLFNATFRKIISERMINAIIHDDSKLL